MTALCEADRDRKRKQNGEGVIGEILQADIADTEAVAQDDDRQHRSHQQQHRDHAGGARDAIE